MGYLTGIKHPEAFHGEGKTKRFFEGWYIKLVSADQSQRWAVIPGIFRGLSDSTDQAFVQVLDGSTGRSWFHEYPVDQFKASTNSFDVWVGPNHFSNSGVTLELQQLTGRINFATPLDPWPVTLAAPGIMGWYGLVPFMECFHGIVSFGHELAGTLAIEGRPTSFDSGRGYIEKDWGKAFPAGYVWMQSNHFATDQNASFIGSVAIIPWLNSEFRGFILGLKHHGKLHQWTTYNRTQEKQLEIHDDRVIWKFDGSDGRLEVEALRVAGGLLHAPIRTAMYQRVEETMLSTISVKHIDKAGNVLFEDQGQVGCMEVFGDLNRLLAIKH